MGAGTTLMLLVIAASLVAMLAQRIRLPYTVALVLAGLGLRWISVTWPDAGLDRFHLTPDILFSLFLPVLLFEAAFHVKLRDFRRNLLAILLLAVPGVVVAIGIGGLLAFWLEPLAATSIPLMVAFLLVSMCAATDPVSVIALFKELGVPKRLMVLMEGESLLNDGVAVVAFMALGVAMGLHGDGESVSAGWLLRFFFWEVGLGLAIGVGVGLLVSYLLTVVDDHLVEITLTTIAAFGSYLIAEAVHASFVLAVVAAGMSCGNVGAHFGMTPRNRATLESFWEYVVFAANSFVFLLLGKEIDLGRLAELAGPILIAWSVLMVARASVITAVAALLSRTSERLPARWPAVLVWGGLRGSLSMVLAVSLPESFAYRQLLIDLTFGVVLVSILFQGLTMAPLLRGLGVVGGGDESMTYQRVRVGLRAARAALHALDTRLNQGQVQDATYERLRELWAGREASLEEALANLEPDERLREHELRQAQESLFSVERETIERDRNQGLISEAAARSLLDELEQRRVDLASASPSA